MSLATSASLNAMPRSILLAKKRIGSFRFLIAETRIQIKYNLHGWSKRFSSSLHATLILNLSAASTTNMIAYHFTFITSLPLIPRSTVPRDCGTCFSRTCQTRWSRFCFCWMSPLWSRLWLLFLFGSTKRVLGETISTFLGLSMLIMVDLPELSRPTMIIFDFFFPSDPPINPILLIFI